MRRRRMLCRRSALMLRRRLAHMRSRLVRVLRRRRAGCVMRNRGILRPWSLSVIRMRGALSCRRTRHIRCTAGVRSRLGLVHVSRRMRRFPGWFRGRRMTRVVRNRGVVRVWSGCCVRPRSILPRWRMRNGVVGVRNIVRGGRALSLRVARMAGIGMLRRPRDVIVVRPRIVRAVLGIRLRSSHRRDVVHGRILRCHHTRTMEGGWFGSCRHLWPSVVHRRPLGAISARHPLMLSLHRRGSNVPLSQRSFLRSSRPRADSSLAAVIADAVHGDVVHGGVVGIVDVGDVYAIDSAVVIEIPAVPIPAIVAVTVIAKAVANAAVEADLRPPVTGIPDVGAFAPSPVAGRPEKTDLGSQHPSPGHPEISIGAVRPITRSPDVTRTRAPRLFINWQRRWSDCHRDKYACK